MHARSHTVNQICMHTLTTLQKASNHLFFVLLVFFFFLSQSTTNFPKGHEMHSQPGPGFYKDHTSQAKPDHSEQVEGCVCLGGGQAVFPNILFSPPDGLERNYYVSDNQPITDIESTSGEGGRCLNRSTLTFLCRDTFLTSRD